MRSSTTSRLPVLRGGVLAFLAAALFGASTPLVQKLGHGLGPFSAAALLSVGAALVRWALRQPVGKPQTTTMGR